MVTYGIIPRYIGITINDVLELDLKSQTPKGKMKLILPPSQFALAQIALRHPNQIRQLIDEHSIMYTYEELEQAVKKQEGSYKLFREMGFNQDASTITAKGLYGYIGTKNDARRLDQNGIRIPTYYQTTVYDINIVNKRIGKYFDVSCGCQDFAYSSGLKGVSRQKIACRHIAIAMTELFMLSTDFGKNIEFAQAIQSGTPLMPYNFFDYPELVVRALEMKYMEKRKMFDIDRFLLSQKELVSDFFKQNYENFVITLEVVKQKENHPEGVWTLQKAISNRLEKLGFEKDAIVLEYDEKARWHFQKDDWGISLVTKEEPWANPSVILYHNNVTPELEEYAKQDPGLHIDEDPLRPGIKRAWREFSFEELSELELLVR